MRNKSDFPCYTFLFAKFTYIFTAQVGDKFWPFSAFADELCTRFCTAIRTRKVKYYFVATASSARDDCVLFAPRLHYLRRVFQTYTLKAVFATLCHRNIASARHCVGIFFCLLKGKSVLLH
jgi:hypothetical protein